MGNKLRALGCPGCWFQCIRLAKTTEQQSITFQPGCVASPDIINAASFSQFARVKFISAGSWWDWCLPLICCCDRCLQRLATQSLVTSITKGDVIGAADRQPELAFTQTGDLAFCGARRHEEIRRRPEDPAQTDGRSGHSCLFPAGDRYWLTARPSGPKTCRGGTSMPAIFAISGSPERRVDIGLSGVPILSLWLSLVRAWSGPSHITSRHVMASGRTFLDRWSHS